MTKATRVIELLHEMAKLRTDCEVREAALYKIRQHVEPGSVVSKIAGRALCYGAYSDRCQVCEEIRESGGFGPSHNGSKNCESGSVASGGKNTHCACDTCF